jgi:hypothetical protein
MSPGTQYTNGDIHRFGVTDFNPQEGWKYSPKSVPLRFFVDMTIRGRSSDIWDWDTTKIRCFSQSLYPPPNLLPRDSNFWKARLDLKKKRGHKGPNGKVLFSNSTALLSREVAGMTVLVAGPPWSELCLTLFVPVWDSEVDTQEGSYTLMFWITFKHEKLFLLAPTLFFNSTTLSKKWLSCNLLRSLRHSFVSTFLKS